MRIAISSVRTQRFTWNSLMHSARAGCPTDTVPVVHFAVESQETVDRDYGGSWNERNRMP